MKPQLPQTALVVIDMTNGFAKPGNPLFVQGGDDVARRFTKQLAAWPANFFGGAWVTNDTHFRAEYPYAPEAQLFPFHQGWGTPEHDYSFPLQDVYRVAPTAVEMLKNQFNPWAGQAKLAVEADQLDFSTDPPGAERAYNGLYRMATRRPDGTLGFGLKRDSYFSKHWGGIRNVVVVGIADDYCVRDAVIGLLQKGYRVTVLTDLVVGIYNPDIPGGVASFEGLCESVPLFAEALKTGQLQRLTSAEWTALQLKSAA